jgi:RimJ/RimL family protein N-acetyltransferase
MNTKVAVRRAAEDDAANLHALRLTIFGETEFMLWEPGEFRDTVEDEGRRIARLNSQPNSACLVAAEGATLVGFLNAMGGQVNRLRHSTILALGVLRASWGQGIATSLLRSAMAWSREAGLRRVELTVHTTNVRAVNLYLRSGFQVEGVRRSSLLVSGKYVDEYLMSVVNEV